MKSVKVMLMSIGLLAVVGGALAFKASSKFGFNFCTTAPRTVSGVEVCTDLVGNALICATAIIDRTTTATGIIKKCWTTTSGDSCPNDICPNLSYTSVEADQNVKLDL